ncbi:MAG: malonyl-CoA synthase [Betaproteobacteria bacterium]|nr:malonyl-CoA synthase [Betaproteobacteria bacterium]
MNENLYALLASRFAGAASSVCLELEDGRRFTYAEVEAESARFANLLASLGLKRGDRVAVQVEKSAEAIFLYLGCLRAGFVYLPLNTAYQVAEISHFVHDAEPAAAFCRPESRASFSGVAHTLSLGDARSQSTSFSTVTSAASDLACIVYTSGTTGRAKGAMLTHRNLSSNALALHAYWQFRPNDVLLHALPIFHVHGLFVALHTALLNASRILLLPRFDAGPVMRLLPRSTVFMGVPTYYVRLLGEPEFDADMCSGMRLFVSGSAPLAADTLREFHARTGHTILERYGMTETGMNTSNPYEGERRPGTVGFPLPGIEVRVAGPGDAPVGAGGIGQIQVKGPNVMPGYWRLPERNKEEFTADGFFRTGDLGRFDEDGYLSIVGREKDLVISGGYNIYPKEIEMVLDELPGVAESAAFGVPHADFGEALMVAVVPRPGAQLSEQQVIGHVKGKLANFKVPKRVVFLQELPRNTMGKVLKNELRAAHGGAKPAA